MTKEEEREPSEAPRPEKIGQQPSPEPAPAPGGARPKGLDYVFRIAPADPKNTLDFEDVADK
jgi:hypothetical protein